MKLLLGVLLMSASACATPKGAPLGPSATPWPSPIVQAPTSLEGVLVLDARKKAAFKKGHVEGAVHAEWTAFRKGLLIGGELKDTADLKKKFEALGVRDDTRVLVCGSGREGWGEEGRIAWSLRYLGHPGVALLASPCKSLKARTWTSASTKIERGALTVRVQEKLRIEKEGVKSAPQILDARRLEEFEGATPYFEKRGGHIPGAKHYWFKNVFDNEGALKASEDVRAEVTKLGLDLDKPIAVYCTGGVRSAYLVEVLRAAGVNAQNYDASFWQWAKDKSLSVEKGAKKAP